MLKLKTLNNENLVKKKVMKISELPPKIKKKALDYQRNSDSYPCEKETDNLQWAFHWKKTTEGHEYWADLHEKDKHHTIIIAIFAIVAILIIIL